MKNHIAISVLLAVIAGVIYTQTLGFDFVNYDDPSYVYKNNHIREGLTTDSMHWAVTTNYFANWIPLTWTSYLLDYTLFELNPAPYHAENTLWHLLNAILLYTTVFLYSGKKPLALFVALLFVLHPMHVESVAWISERKGLLSTFFALLALIAYQQGALRGKRLLIFSALALYAASLLAKPMLMTLPFLLLLLDYAPLRRFDDPEKRKLVLLEKVPFFVLTLLDLAATIWAQSGANAIQNESTFPLSERIPNALYSYGLYIGKFLIPHPMLPFYPHPEATLPLWKPTLALILLIAISALAWRTRKNHPGILIGWVWYLIALVPVIGFIQVGGQAMADRYTYVPYIGLSILLYACVAPFIQSKNKQRLTLVVASVWMMALTTVAGYQTAHWKNSITLFTHTIRHSPQNLVALTNLGEAYINAKNYGPAIETIATALEIMPDSLANLRNLGSTYRKGGRLAESEQLLRHALTLDQRDPDTLNQLAITLYNSGRPAEGVPLLRIAVEQDPNHADAHNNLGNALLATQDTIYAILHYKRSLALNPHQPKTWANLGAVYIVTQDFEAAIEPILRSLEFEPDNHVTHVNYAVVLSRLGKPEEALAHTQRALEINPNYDEGIRLLQALKDLQQN